MDEIFYEEKEDGREIRRVEIISLPEALKEKPGTSILTGSLVDCRTEVVAYVKVDGKWHKFEEGTEYHSNYAHEASSDDRRPLASHLAEARVDPRLIERIVIVEKGYQDISGQEPYSFFHVRFFVPSGDTVEYIRKIRRRVEDILRKTPEQVIRTALMLGVDIDA